MAKQIKSFGLSRLTVGSTSEFHNNILALINQSGSAELHIDDLAPAYQEAASTLAAVINRQRAYVSTAELTESDRQRDNAVGTISNVVNAYETTPVEEKRAAAGLLAPQLSIYKGIRKHEYSKETSEIRGLIEVLTAEGNRQAVTTLGLDAEVEALQQANAAFEEAFAAKAAEKSEHMETGDIDTTETIATLNGLYGRIVQVVNVYAIVQPTDTINNFIDGVNGFVGSFTDIINRTGTANDAGTGTDNEGGASEAL